MRRQPNGTVPAGPVVPARPRPAHAGPRADEGPIEPPFQLLGPAAVRSGLRLRPRTIRARIVSLLMVPVVSLMALWGFAAVTTAQDVDALVRSQRVDALLLTPVAGVVADLQAERTAAAVSATAPDRAHAQALAARGHATDADLAALDGDLALGAADIAGLSADLPSRLDAFRSAAAGLPALRARAGAGALGWADTMAGYTAVVAAAFDIDGSLSGVLDAGHDSAQAAAPGSDPRVLLELARARDLLAREDAAVQSALATGRLGADQAQEFTGAMYGRQVLTAAAVPDLRPQDRDAYLAVGRGHAATALAGFESALRGAGPGQSAVLHQLQADQWSGSAQDLARQYAAVESAATADAAADPYAMGVFTRNGAAVLFGLLAVLLSLLISVRIGRRLVVELVELRDSALDLAGRRLPDAMRRLRAGQSVDVAAEAPATTAGEDELGQVGRALHTVQRAALTAAVERAEVLSGVSGVFVNLARRSQVLVHRQLALLDTMERRTEDPAELEDLFRLDHLTTRMRRHAEGLIILSGAAPGRGWRRAVPLLDVVRSAVAEVEEFSRVEVRPLPRVSVVGPAVADLTHLVAELVENATGFSPPHTKVLVSGERVGAGYALDIEDRGLGMSGEAIAEANRRIADGQQTDLFDSNQLGLFVVSRLARRHGIRVSLRASPYGGTTAVLLLPVALLSADPPPGPVPAHQPRREPAHGPDLALDRESRHGPAREPDREPGRLPGRELRREPVHGLDGEPDRESRREPVRGFDGELDRESRRLSGLLPRREPGRESGRGARREPGDGTDGAPPRGAGAEPRRGPREADPDEALALSTGSAVSPGRTPSPFSTPRIPARTPVRNRGTAAAPPPAPDAAAPAPDDDELPLRVRQASLAAQLREPTGTDPDPDPRAEGDPALDRRSLHTPERARATLSAMADGWTRGRNDTPFDQRI